MIGSVVTARTDAVEKRILERQRTGDINRWIPACEYGKFHEGFARQKYQEFMKRAGYDVTIFKCGLMVDERFPYLACTPDGLVRVHGSMEFPLVCLEIKTVYDTSSVARSLEDIAAGRANFYLKLDKEDKKLKLKKSHSYWYQIQLQLLITNLALAHLAVYLPKKGEFHVFEILPDVSTTHKIVEKAKSFYDRHLQNNQPIENRSYSMIEEFVKLEELLQPMEIDVMDDEMFNTSTSDQFHFL